MGQNGSEELICKYCGAPFGEEIFAAVGGIVQCKYCKTYRTLPKENTSPAALHYLRNGEFALDTCHFEDALTAYRKVAELEAEEPEAYFGMALAKFRVQTLKDVVNRRLQPLCYAISDISERKFCDDADYQKALSLATPAQREDYEARGREIDEIKDEFSRLEREGTVYDCFLCVKVTEEDRVTPTADKARAAEIYKQLKKLGYRPFYSEEENKGRTGSPYEALILYALYTSKCMLIVCSNPDYLETPWVKNEYTRFLNMRRGEAGGMKKPDSLTFVYDGRPVERLPLEHDSKRIQGIDWGKPDHMERIEEYVRRQVLGDDVRLTGRKKYGDASVAPKAAMKQTIEKRKIETIRPAADVSEEVQLSIAEGFLAKGEFKYAKSYCMEVLGRNKGIARAYWILFLAQYGCKDDDAIAETEQTIDNFEYYEKALACSGEAERRNYYTVLYRHVVRREDFPAYCEYIALPESAEGDIAALSEIMYRKALRETNKDVFDTVIRTVTDTEQYISMNDEFAHALGGGRVAIPYFQNILKAYAGHKEAMFAVFRAEHDLSSDKAVVTFCAKSENASTVESSLFAYGFNDYAVKELFGMISRRLGSDPDGACRAFDLLLQMFPSDANDLYAGYVNAFISLLFDGEMYDRIGRYNDLLLEIDPHDDAAYFNRVLIDHRTNNPLSLLRYVGTLIEDENYKHALDFYLMRHGEVENNIYLSIYTCLKELAELLQDDACIEFAISAVRLRDKSEILTCRPTIRNKIKEQSQKYWKAFLKDCSVTGEEELYTLTRDVTNNENLKKAALFASVGGNSGLSVTIDRVLSNQPRRARQNFDSETARLNRERERRLRERANKFNFILLVLVPIAACLGGLAGSFFSYLEKEELFLLTQFFGDGARIAAIFTAALSLVSTVLIILTVRENVSDGWSFPAWLYVLFSGAVMLFMPTVAGAFLIIPAIAVYALVRKGNASYAPLPISLCAFAISQAVMWYLYCESGTALLLGKILEAMEMDFDGMIYVYVAVTFISFAASLSLALSTQAQLEESTKGFGYLLFLLLQALLFVFPAAVGTILVFVGIFRLRSSNPTANAICWVIFSMGTLAICFIPDVPFWSAIIFCGIESIVCLTAFESGEDFHLAAVLPGFILSFGIIVWANMNLGKILPRFAEAEEAFLLGKVPDSAFSELMIEVRIMTVIWTIAALVATIAEILFGHSAHSGITYGGMLAPLMMIASLGIFSLIGNALIPPIEELTAGYTASFFLWTIIGTILCSIPGAIAQIAVVIWGGKKTDA